MRVSRTSQPFLWLFEFFEKTNKHFFMICQKFFHLFFLIYIILVLYFIILSA